MKFYSLFLVVCSLVLVSCNSSPQKHFFVLSTVNKSTEQKSTAHKISLGILPVQTAEYLNRLSIITQTENNQLQLSQQDFWAEPLDKGIARTLGSNLSQLQPNLIAVIFPWRMDTRPDYTLRIQISNLSRSKNTAAMSGSWELVKGRDNQIIKRKTIDLTTESGSDSQALAKAYSELIGTLSMDISSAISLLENE